MFYVPLGLVFVQSIATSILFFYRRSSRLEGPCDGHLCGQPRTNCDMLRHWTLKFVYLLHLSQNSSQSCSRGGWTHILKDPFRILCPLNFEIQIRSGSAVCNYSLNILAKILTNINNEFESNQQNQLRIRENPLKSGSYPDPLPPLSCSLRIWALICLLICRSLAPVSVQLNRAQYGQ